MGILSQLKDKTVGEFAQRCNDIVTQHTVVITSIQFVDGDKKAGIYVNMRDEEGRGFVDVVTIPADNPEPTLNYLAMHIVDLTKQLGSKPESRTFGDICKWLAKAKGAVVKINTERSEYNPEYININFALEA